ncbi:hypothetical protein KKC08_02185 [Patescibacteria group bacterium]|nr:hypothetical protein [Patescibacteria group bacterium]MCG2702259.1 hypothetical protein [Candidatus Parcubacteria bacterium]MBU4264727.1 hypothetical protein [Patescibacteria group bacterium]MBU4390065.1 hypothetical protein [Patescibacteria group bacterium]MBU4396948.1 hypothetical protein [Patescibacteria group bacterium]
MYIQLYDRGTSKGKKLFKDIETICKSYQIDRDPEHITNMHRVYELGIQGETILLINNKPILIDQYPDIKELEQILSDYLNR